MAEPALKLATKFLRVAVENFDMGWLPAVEDELQLIGVDLTDLHNALLGCEVQRSNKIDAGGASFVVSGETTEGERMKIRVWVDPDARVIRVDEVTLVSGVGR